MEKYRLRIKRSAAKELEALPSKDRRRIVGRIQSLASDPRAHGCEKLSGEDKYRIRQGDYRVLYAVQDADATVIVVKIAHRRDAYR